MIPEDPMRADTRTVSIEADPARLVDFLADAHNLPRWAVGFAKAVRPDGDHGWVVETGGGDMPLRIDVDRARGVVDFLMAPAPGVEARAASRVVPRGAGSEYVFTQFQAPGMDDEAFARSVQTLAHELVVLKALMEVECPL
jgi:hypothetical protein